MSIIMIASFMPRGLLIKITQNNFSLNTVKNNFFFIISFIIHPKTHSKEFYFKKSADLLSELSYQAFPYPLRFSCFFRCLFWLLLIRYQDSSEIFLSSECSSGRAVLISNR